MSGQPHRSKRRRRRPSVIGRWIRRLFVFFFAVALSLVVATALPVRWLRDHAPPTSAFMLLAERADPATGEPCDAIAYEWVDREQIASDLPLAVVVAEDQKFLLHRASTSPRSRRP